MEEKIILAAIEEFEKNGLKFTMDDVAKHLQMSKKTLYTVFSTKEALLFAIVDYCFADIKRAEKKILIAPDMDILEKIKSIIIVIPDRYRNIGLSRLGELEEKAPKVYERVQHYLQSDWDATIRLLEEGMALGKIKRISVPILKSMVESTIASFFSGNVLVDNELTYEQGLNLMMDIIMDGILVQRFLNN